MSMIVLLLLTIMGVGLAMTTQTEIQIGASEATTTRVFYAADAGLEVALARGLASADHSAVTFRMSDHGGDLANGDYEFVSEVVTSPLVPILDTTCSLCEINDAGTYSENAFRRINHAVMADAERYGTLDAGATRQFLAAKRIGGMIEIQPWKVAPSALFPIDDPVQMAKIRF
jgi:hypothetical protein